MKVIDLLNKIANGEEVPKKIKFYGNYYIWYDNRYTGNEGYCLEPVRSDSNSFLEINTVYDLNYEIEILEEKKIPENEDELIGYNIQEFDNLKEFVEITTNDVFGKINKIINKQNKIIDYLKSKGDE